MYRIIWDLIDSTDTIDEESSKKLELLRIGDTLTNIEIRHILTYCLNNYKYDMFTLLTKYIDIDNINDCDSTFLTRLIRLDLGSTTYHHRFFEVNNDIMFILSHTKNINMKTSNDDTAIISYISVMRDYNMLLSECPMPGKIITKMLEMGADIFHQNSSGHSALNMAMSMDNYDLVKLLLENAKFDYANISVLHDSLANGDCYDVIELLLLYIKDIKEKDTSGRDVYSFIDDCDENIKELIDHSYYNI